jgi:Predicted restriction endonuclease
MNEKTCKALLGYGISTRLIKKIASTHHTLGSLRESGNELLRADFTEEEIEELKAKLQRNEIPAETIDRILNASDGVCCVCADGNTSRPYQLHHIRPYSETQDNSSDNIALVCPTHHVAIHGNKPSVESQKLVRNQWYKIATLAKDYQQKGIPFPFDLLEAVDYGSRASPRELVQLGPLSPSTATLSYPPELADKALSLLKSDFFALVFGDSGSGKSTFALAIGGISVERGVNVFGLRFGKQRNDTLQQLLVLFFTCV